jgi:hypothetical protein
MTGTIDELALYGRALSPGEIWQHYDIGTGGRYAREVMGDAPVWYSRLGEPTGTTTRDEIGALDGTLTNTPTLAAGALIRDSSANLSMSFDRASSEYVDVPDNATLDQGNGPWSWEAWFELTSVNRSTIFGKGTGAGSLQVNKTTVGRVHMEVVGSGESIEASGGPYNDGLIHHVVVTHNGATDKLYIDGVDVTVVLASNATSSTADNLNIGRMTGVGNAMDGRIDEPAIYSTVLTLAQVQAHYAAGIGRYAAKVRQLRPVGYWRMDDTTEFGTIVDDVNSAVATPVNSPTNMVTGALSPDGPRPWYIDDGNRAYSFDSTSSEHFTVPDRTSLDVGDVVSLTGWFKTGSVAALDMIFSKGGTAFGLGMSSGKLYFGQATGGDSCRSIRSLNDQEWHHFVAVKNGATATLYIDGLDDTDPIGSVTLTNTATSLYIGADSAGANTFDGELDELAIFPTGLTGADALALYQAGSGGPYGAMVRRDNPIWYSRLADPTVVIDEMQLGDGVWEGHTPGMQAGPLLDGSDDNFASLHFRNFAEDYLSVAHTAEFNFGTADFSLEVWYQMTGVNNLIWFMSKDTQFGYLIDSGNRLNLDNFSTYGGISPAGVNADLLWHHTVVTRAGSVYNLYLDGIDVTSANITQTFTASSNPFTIGVENDLFGWFEGRLAQPAVYSRVLTPTEVVEHYNAAGYTVASSGGYEPPPIIGGGLIW